MIRNYLPHCCVGPIVKGFGRGSKDLGCPTGNLDALNTNTIPFPFPFNHYELSANFALDVVQKLPVDIETGVYFGWAKVDKGEVYKAVLSIGWNPFYGNKEKSVVSSIDQMLKFFDHIEGLSRIRFRWFHLRVVIAMILPFY